jgi:hypothetical protein
MAFQKVEFEFPHETEEKLDIEASERLRSIYLVRKPQKILQRIRIQPERKSKTDTDDRRP